MNGADIKKARGNRRQLQQEIAIRSTDPRFYSALEILPNPDTVLRKLGKSDEVFDAIASDAHVIGELRSVRSGVLGYEHRVQPGGDSPADIKAWELCNLVMSRKPAPGLYWSDIKWSIMMAIFRGRRVHEVVWARDGNYLLPAKILDRPTRRFIYNNDNEMRLLTRQEPVKGDELGNYKWLVTRHMATHENPYGVALFSACFWPYTFKHNGFRFFSKFCEKYGIPWAVGKYPIGTPKEDQDALADALAQMVEDAVAAIPDDGSVELIESSTTGEIVHERLIKVCNSEMSKALTSQTLATDIQGQGSRAAAETHRERETTVNATDRSIIEETISQLFAWITELNIPGAMPPRFEFYEEGEARQDWVEYLDAASDLVDVPKEFAYDRLQIPVPKDGEEILQRRSKTPPATPPEFSACPRCGGAHDFKASEPTKTDAVTTAADGVIETIIDQVRDFAAKANSLEELESMLQEHYPDLSITELGEMTAAALLEGMVDGAGDETE